MTDKKEKTISPREAFDAWRKEYPNATEESARKVWAMYNADAEDPDADFPTGIKFASPDDAVSAQTGVPKKDAPAV